jgi:hypothetical protein
MTDDDHRELARVLHSVQGKVALSGYHCDLMRELYCDWNYIEAPAKLCHSIKTERIEVLWINYELPKHFSAIVRKEPQMELIKRALLHECVSRRALASCPSGYAA